MKVTFRIDDVNPWMDWEKFMSFMEVMGTYNIRPLLGVVPDCEDKTIAVSAERDSFWMDMRRFQEEGCCIALHGYDHIYRTEEGGIFPLNSYSEFAGVPYEIQRQKIEKGLDIFREHGLKSDIFMAPGHSFDQNTVKALKSCGVKYMTDGYQKSCYERYGMIFLPVITGIRDIPFCCRKNFDLITVVVHTNTVQEKLFNQYKMICEKLKEDLISYKQAFELPVKEYNACQEREKVLEAGIMKRIYALKKKMENRVWKRRPFF